MKAQPVCLHCKQVIRKPRAAKSTNKHYVEDIAKANAAIATLETTIARNWNPLTPTGYGYNTVIQAATERPDFIEACELELERMQRAVNDPELLWSIYRRKFAKTGPRYGLEAAQPIIRTQYTNVFAQASA